MIPTRPRSIVAALSWVSWLAVATSLPTQALAGERRARLTVDVKVEGAFSVVGTGNERESGEFHDSYHLVTYLKTDGDPSPINTKDPQYGQKMMARAAWVQRRVAEAQGQMPSAKKVTPQEMQAALQQKQVACKGDQGCLMQLAMEASSMMANVDTGAPQGAVVPEEPPEEEEPRYLTYFGFDDCGAETHVLVDRKVSGSYDDVQGSVPYSTTEKADDHADPVQIRLICNSQNLVLDVKTQTIFTDGVSAPSARGTSRSTESGRSTESEGDAWHAPGWEWVTEQVRQAPASGRRSTTLVLDHVPGGSRVNGKQTGQARIEMSWKFEDVAP